MPRIVTGMGGTTGQQGAPQPQGQWRQSPQLERPPGVDWTLPQLATPQPGRTQRFGSRHRGVALVDVPQLPERRIKVRAKGLGTHYTADGMPIPGGDEWVSLPISPGLIQAIKDGDLERGSDDTPTGQPRPRRTAAE